MHDTALAHAQLFFETYLGDGEALRILEVGSADVNGGLRGLAPAGSDYVGVDFAVAPGVDVILDDPMTLPFADASFDVCVTSSCFEHAPFFWQTAVEIARVLKPGGLFYLNAPEAILRGDRRADRLQSQVPARGRRDRRLQAPRPHRHRHHRRSHTPRDARHLPPRRGRGSRLSLHCCRA